MIEEALEFLKRQAIEAAKPVHLQVEQEPDHVYYIQGEDGEFKRREAAPDPRAHTLDSIDDLCQFVLNYTGPVSEEAGERVIFYNRASVVGILNDNTRRDRVKLDLVPSPQIKTLFELQSAKAFNQKQFLRLLRVSLNGCFVHNTGFIDMLRSLKFKRSEEGVSIETQGKRNVGKSLEAEVTAAQDFPDQVTLSVPPFEGTVLPLMLDLTCVLEVEPTEGHFFLIPPAGALEKLMCRAEAALGEAIVEKLGDDAPVRVYFGQP